MNYGHAAILVLLVGCSSPKPTTPTTVYEWYQQHSTNETHNGRHRALAGPDIRFPNGEFAYAMHDKYVYSYVPGFNMASSAKSMKSAINTALKLCEKQIGKNDCYIYFENDTYVRIAERKKWLKRNPSARRTIAAEKQKDQERRRLAAQRLAPANANATSSATVIIN